MSEKCKKIISILLLAVICTALLASCGKKTLEEATTEANAKLQDMDNRHLNLCEYVPMKSNPGFYNIILVDTSNDSLMCTKYMLDTRARIAYDEIKPCFKGFDVKVNITFMDSSQSILYMYDDAALASIKID